MDRKIKDMINEQINKEFYSAYLYLDFANYYYDKGLDGFANWYDVQAQEERDHAMLMRTYLQNNGECVIIAPSDLLGLVDQAVVAHDVARGQGTDNLTFEADGRPGPDGEPDLPALLDPD